MSKRRFEEWAGTGWPEGWRKLFPREDGGSGVLWPIVDNETSGQIQGFPKPEQWFAAALTPEAQRMICTALNTPRTEALPQWISVDERLPADEEPVLAYFGKTKTTHVLWLELEGEVWFDPHSAHDGGMFSSHSSRHITHWMAMPQAPVSPQQEKP